MPAVPRLVLFDRPGRAKRRDIATLRELNNHSIPDAVSSVILGQPSAEASRLGTDRGVLFGIKPGLSTKDLDAYDGFLELAIPALQMTLDDHPQKPGEALITGEPRARQYAFQVLPHVFG